MESHGQLILRVFFKDTIYMTFQHLTRARKETSTESPLSEIFPRAKSRSKDPILMRKRERKKRGNVLAIGERKRARERERKRAKKGMREKAAHAHVSETYTYEYLRTSFHDVT